MTPEEIQVLFEYTVQLPIYSLGTLVNGVVLFVILHRRQVLLRTRIDQIYCALISVCLCWAVFGIVHTLLPKDDVVTQQLSAALNVLLALERYRILREIPFPQMKKWFLASITFTSSIFIIFIACFIASPCSNGVYPDHMPILLTYLGTASLGFLVGLPAMIILYISTYRHVTTKLSAALADHHTDQIRHMIQQKVLRNTVIMTAGTLICYLPLSILMTLRGLKIVDINTIWGISLNEAIFTIVSLDVLFTPCLIIYFSASLSAFLRFWEKNHENKKDWAGEYDDSGGSGGRQEYPMEQSQSEGRSSSWYGRSRE
ncbi:UNVERIFIED_CONTAM: hypothetical protein HDU68_007563 [Siphonaria sp. JEL0065]|nr:hypothetical protein HDU68_007563 [Siphonaria sp. JEL0065]